MEHSFPAIWNVLHDGAIVKIVGSVPGDLNVHVGIEYLRECFADSGENIFVRLSGCTMFSLRRYDSENTITDLNTIVKESPSILSAEGNDVVCRVFTDVGLLEMQCDGVSVALDSGRKISVGELNSVAEAYWSQWDLKSKQDNDT